MSQDSSVKALSPIRDTKRGNSSTSSQLGEVLPANRSSLSPFKSQSLILKRLSDLISNEKKNLMPRRKNMQHQDHEITYMTGYSIINEKPSKEKLIAPCSARNRKLLSIENAVMQQIEVSQDQSFGAKKFETTGPLGINLVNLENLQILMASAHRILNLVHEYYIKIKELLKRSKLSFSSRRTKEFSPTLCPVVMRNPGDLLF